MEKLKSEDGQLFIKVCPAPQQRRISNTLVLVLLNLANFVRTHEKALANASPLRRQSKNAATPQSQTSSSSAGAFFSSTSQTLAAALSFGALKFGSQNIKPAKLTLTPHHLFYLLSRLEDLEDLSITVGPMNVLLENIHTEVSRSYISFLNQTQRSKADGASIHPNSSVRSIKSGMSGLWSSFSLESKDSTSKSEKVKIALEADLMYLYSAFTKIPCLRLAPDRRALLIRGFEEYPFDTALPLDSFKNLSALEIIDIDYRSIYGWDHLSEQLRTLTVKGANLDDPANLLTRIVLDNIDTRRRRSAKSQQSPPLGRTSSTGTQLVHHPDHTSISALGSLVAETALASSTSPHSVPMMRAGSEGTKIRVGTESMPPRPFTEHSHHHSRGQSARIRRTGSVSSNSSDIHDGYRTRGSATLLPGVLPPLKWRLLRHLGFPENSLTSISASSLTPVANTLNSLDLSSNLLTEIPDSLASLMALRALNLSHCMIESLHSLARSPLPAITALNLRGNRLRSLAGIERLISLERVDLRDNDLMDPMEMVRLTSLPKIREIWVSGNPFVKTHSGYRVVIMNLFRQTPGYSEDIIVDGRGPGYTERKQLVEQVMNLSHPTPGYADDIIVDDHGPGYTEHKQLVEQDFYATIGSRSQSVSSRVFSAGQDPTLDSQTPFTAPTAPTASKSSELEIDDLRTIYSDTLTMDGSIKEVYVNELARELLKAVSTFRLDSASTKRVADAMPGCLKAFSVRLGCINSSQQAQRDVTVFIHKYRHASTERKCIVDDNMPLNEKMKLWLRHDADSASDISFPPVVDDDAGPSKHSTILLPLTEIDEESNPDAYPVMPGLQKYRECVLKNPAYDWLLGDIQRHCLLAHFNPNIIADIGSSILRILPSHPRFSRRESVPLYQMTYTLGWDLVSFLEDQEYSEGNLEALPLVITLTGSREAAQALSCSQYLHQTWPSSAGKMLKLLQDLLRTRPGEKAMGNLPDGTNLVAWFDSSSEASKNPKIVFEVKGSAYSIAEVGEQLSWLGSALRSSPQTDQVVYCQPQVSNLSTILDESRSGKKQKVTEFSANISFAVKHLGTSSKVNGECWHDLVRSGVVVEGFPISRRPEVGTVKGLDIPLPMMARLAQANYVNTFLGSLVIKGFSSMLIPTENHEEMIVWHLVHNKNGDRISYLDSKVLPVQELSASQLSQARHILGWCANARHLAGMIYRTLYASSADIRESKGTRDAAYGISGSHLLKLREDGLLSQAFIYNSQMIKGGASFLMGYKDNPLHVSRGGYVRKLKWIIQKSVVLWDEEAKRGWLLNGASALLHLVRASILHDTTGPFSSEFYFKWKTLEEATVDSKNASEFALAVLLNHKNRALTIYEGKDDHIKFEDRVEHFLNILEQMFDYQVHAAGPDGSGYSSKAIPRAHFEGWDFHDLATEVDSLRPRRATFAPEGKTWIDFARSIHAVNLLGCNFGEILAPSDVSCPYWASLPKGQYYLAAGISDLKMVLDYTGDLTTNPIRLSENLVWHNSETVSEPCGCDNLTADHADIVQVILPDTLSAKSETCLHTANLSPKGAVIFGYNRNFQWRWGDSGDPERDEIAKYERTPLSPTIDLQNTNSNSISFGSDSDNLVISSAQNHLTATDITIDSASVGDEPVQPKPLVRSYTRWQLESLTSKDYAVGIVCALPLELLAVRALFDQTHPDLPLSAADSNHYALGSMGRHKVVAACLPDGEYGTNSAADVAANLRRSFPLVRFCLLVGIGGGVPSSRNDIRLGDVVVSKPNSMGPGVIQYDMGKTLEDGEFQQIGFLQPPPRLVMTAVSSLKSDPYLPQAPLQEYIQEITACRKEYRYPGPEHDHLFPSHYSHKSKLSTCDSCNVIHVTKRPSRSDHHPQIHYGLIASGNRVMKDAKLRDRWSMERDVLCFEMEAAGIMNTLPCLAIRGICDYSDSHKNKRFQEYAAATAASYAKLLLSYMKDSSDLDGAALRSGKEDQSLLGVFRRALSFMG
ncbi:hypothetical protein N7501_000114 [Penicillium viridicatum]|nr:hypothetical protein N7501_000114 [Penicillium viridicatum]